MSKKNIIDFEYGCRRSKEVVLKDIKGQLNSSRALKIAIRHNLGEALFTNFISVLYSKNKIAKLRQINKLLETIRLAMDGRELGQIFNDPKNVQHRPDAVIKNCYDQIEAMMEGESINPVHFLDGIS